MLMLGIAHLGAAAGLAGIIIPALLLLEAKGGGGAREGLPLLGVSDAGLDGSQLRVREG